MEQETGNPQTANSHAPEPRAGRGRTRAIGAAAALILLIAGGAFLALRPGGSPAAGDAVHGGAGTEASAPSETHGASSDGAAPAATPDGTSAANGSAASAPPVAGAAESTGASAAAPGVAPGSPDADTVAAAAGGGAVASGVDSGGGSGSGSGSGSSTAGSGTAGSGGGAAVVEVVNLDPPVTVQVLSAKRVAADTLRVELTLVSRSTAPGALDLRGLAASSGPVSGGARPAVAVGTHPLSLTDLCVLTASGSRRLFALRDDQGKPVGAGDFAPLAPGERRTIWAMFPAPPAADTHATLLVGGIALRNVPIS